MRKNSERRPVGGNQLAQAFAWECRRYVRSNGCCALLIPAMSLFEEPSRRFRAEFFRVHRVHTVANFSNLAEVLFAGRSRVPAAALFFAPRPEAESPDQDEFVTAFSPLVANQEPTRPTRAGKRNESWSLVINASEVREIPTTEPLGGSGLPWKLATWGSAWDSRLLARLSRRWPTLESLEAGWDSKEKRFVAAREDQLFGVSEGLQLREGASQEEAVEAVEEVSGKKTLNVKALKGSETSSRFQKRPLNCCPLTVNIMRERAVPACRWRSVGLPMLSSAPPAISQFIPRSISLCRHAR